jgi:hypothetical protein
VAHSEDPTAADPWRPAGNVLAGPLPLLPMDVTPPRRTLRLPIPRPLSRRLVRAAGDRRRSGEGLAIGELIATLGDRSFGWAIMLFAVVNLMPIPPGSTMITAIPLVIVTGQMALGLPQLRLPGWITRREIGRKRFQKAVMRLRPLIRPIERVVRPRHVFLFTARNEQLLGMILVAISVALFVPIPLSAYLPAAALLVTGIGLVERDGLVTFAGVMLGVVSIAVTVTVGLAAGACAPCPEPPPSPSCSRSRCRPARRAPRRARWLPRARRGWCCSAATTAATAAC